MSSEFDMRDERREGGKSFLVGVTTNVLDTVQCGEESSLGKSTTFLTHRSSGST